VVGFFLGLMKINEYWVVVKGLGLKEWCMCLREKV